MSNCAILSLALWTHETNFYLELKIFKALLSFKEDQKGGFVINSFANIADHG